MDWFVPLSVPTPLKVSVSAAAARFVATKNAFNPATIAAFFLALAVPSRAKVARGAAVTLLATTGVFFTPAAPFAEATTVSRYHQPLSLPAKALSRHTVRATSTGATPVFSAQGPAEQVTPDRWSRPLEQPRARPRARLAEGVTYAPFVEAAPAAVTLDWLPQANQPIRQGIAVVSSEAGFVATGEGPTPPAQFYEAAWASPLADPTRRITRRPVSDVSFVALVTAAPETITPDKWLVALATPVRKPGLATALQQSIAFGKPEASDEKLDRWFQPLAQPQRRVARAKAQETVSFVAVVQAQAPLPDFGWYAPTSQPQLPSIVVVSTLAPFIATGAGPDAPPEVDPGTMTWFQQLSRPYRDASFQVVEVNTGFVVDIATVDDWWRQLSEPKRFRKGLGAWQQQTFGFVQIVQAAPETITIDKWYRPFVEIVPPKRALHARHQQALAFVQAAPFEEATTVDRWHQPLSAPTPKRSLPVRNQQSFAVVHYIPDTAGSGVGTSEWLVQLSQPIRRKTFQQPADPFFVYVAPAAPAPSFDWLVELSRPVARKARAAHGGQIAPVTVPTLAYEWAVPLASPVRLKPPLARGDAYAAPVFTPTPAAPVAIDWFAALNLAPKAARRPAHASPWAFVELRPLPGFGWFSPLGEPPKPKLSLCTALQSSVVFARFPDDPPIPYRRQVDLTGSVDRLRTLLGSIDRKKPLTGSV